MSPAKPPKLRIKAARRSANLPRLHSAQSKRKAFTPTPPDKIDAVLESIAGGEWTRAALKLHGVDAQQFYRTMDRDDDAAQRYARAKAAQMMAVAEELQEIQDERPPLRDPGGLNPGDPRVDPAWVTWQKNRVDTRKWLLAKLAPKKFGDRVEQVLTGAEGGPIQTESTVALPGLEEFAAKLDAVLGKKE